MRVSINDRVKLVYNDGDEALGTVVDTTPGPVFRCDFAIKVDTEFLEPDLEDDGLDDGLRYRQYTDLNKSVFPL